MRGSGPYLPPLVDPIRRIGRRTFDFDRQIVVMAVVNRTPDSFFDEGRTEGFAEAVAAALAADAAGADWVDIGGVPFSPDAPDVTVAEELGRVLPVIAAVAERSDIVISVDTFRAEVAAAAIHAGASVVNDTSGLHDPALAEVVAGSTATLVITHSLAPPRRHLRRPAYGDLLGEISQFLRSRVELAMALGVPPERIVLDPGHDLNKNTYHSLALTRRLTEIADLGLPVLAAVSNKDFVGEATGLAKEQRLAPSLAAATACILHGARIVRMHDPAPAVAAARMVAAILGLAAPAYVRHNLD